MAVLLIVDPQNDFHAGGSLAVPGAEEDCARLCAFVRVRSGSLAQVAVTLDSHQRLHIAHGLFWESAEDGSSPAPFTTLTHEDVRDGRWRTRDERYRAHGVEYTRGLEEKGKFQLTIWPEHCLIGSPGHNVVPDLFAALSEWTEASMTPVTWVHKGSNPLTEHYSALHAEVELEDDPKTQLNRELLDLLLGADKVFIAGQALSHCVNFTMRDLVGHWPEDRRSDLILLKDCASSVPGCDEAGAAFVADMEAAGCVVCNVAEAPEC